MPTPKCPYLDKECPKIQELEEEQRDIKKALLQVQKYLYIAIGMIAVNWGFTLW